MAHTHNHALRLLRELEPFLPEGVEQVLDRPSYWDPGFCELFFERIEELTFFDPQAGVTLARVAPRLALAVPEELGPSGRKDHRKRVVRAYGLLATALRKAGLIQQAGKPLQMAFRICDQERISGSGRAELCIRRALHLSGMKRFEEALDALDRATELYQLEGDAAGIGLALATRGTVCAQACWFPEAVTILSEALGNYKLGPKIELSATHNLAYAVSEATHPDLDSATRHLKRARQLLGPRRSVQKCKLYWVEGLILIRRGRIDRAERLFWKSRDGFLKFQAPYDIALVSLDLSALLRFERRWAVLEELTADTFHRFRELREDAEAVASLKLWIESVQNRALTEELISTVKTTIEERMWRGPLPIATRRRRAHS